MSEDRKITYILSHPIQYFAPLLGALAKVTDLEVYYLSDASIKGQKDAGFGKPIAWDTALLDGYPAFFIRNFGRRGNPDNHFWDVFNPGVVGVIRKRKRSIVIVNGWTYSSTLLAILSSKLLGRKVWLRAENPLNQELRKSRRVLFLKRLFLKHLLFRYFIDKCLYIGTESRKFFGYYGVPADRLVYTPYAVDNAFFSEAYQHWKGRTVELKQKLGLPPNKKIILFVGKYTPKKRPLDLLEAFRQLQPADHLLVMVGEGELRPEMEKFTATRALKEKVVFTGFVNQSRIPLYYSVADVFVMCSGMGETWGLAVNEAMNFAKPVIVSDTCGCSADLVRHGGNGFIFEEGNIGQLRGYLQQVLADGPFAEKAGLESMEIVREFSIQRIVQNVSQAI
ncbi:MAG TPA: glycosyltransferase family 4 protein [Puia sp.]|nr:glycosyltransferase family 4 protein [Puia sp.]